MREFDHFHYVSMLLDMRVFVCLRKMFAFILSIAKAKNALAWSTSAGKAG